MAKFLSGNVLNAEIEDIIEGAERLIILISPYIKLHERYASVLKTKKDNPEIKLVIVFGKNEDDISKSMIAEDFNFFKEFPNVHIYYEKRLHAKYVANESASIITSMNFHKYSQDNNIEVGVRTELGSFIGSKIGIGDSDFENNSWEYFQRVIEQAELVYKKEPEFKNGFWNLIKSYKGSKVMEDKLSAVFENKTVTPNKTEVFNTTITHGYCIRTGKKIQLNHERPLSNESYSIWAQFCDYNYPENYCHFTGEKSNGDTCVATPVLTKNWKKYLKAIEQ